MTFGMWKLNEFIGEFLSSLDFCWEGTFLNLFVEVLNGKAHSVGKTIVEGVIGIQGIV